MDIVITTIFPPTEGARKFASGVRSAGVSGSLWVVGDRKGPGSYDVEGARFFSIDCQKELDFKISKNLPESSYTRKNIGYLLAIESGAELLVESDDDNIPLGTFWAKRTCEVDASPVNATGWFNAYRCFTQKKIWPRGLPLEVIQESWNHHASRSEAPRRVSSFIQQGLANENPDVDAVYRLVCELPISFEDHEPIFLGKNCWCPFNSQNTTFFKPAFPLLYLPSYCSFRMTDIWRSFVAQRCLWEMDSFVTFSNATVYQERNEHSLLRDFRDEVPGYLNNDKIRKKLEDLDLKQGKEPVDVLENLYKCYESLVRANIVPKEELELVRSWSDDLLGLY